MASSQVVYRHEGGDGFLLLRLYRLKGPGETEWRKDPVTFAEAQQLADAYSAKLVEERTAEVYEAMENRWRESNAAQAELGLIAEAVGVEFDGEPTLIERGVVLAAVRERCGPARGGPADGD
jgi:hypothetical protein